jgi:hypothetical protein
VFRTSIGICLALTIGLLLSADKRADGCMAFFHGDFKGTYEINEETAIIIWDAVNKTEHFIRRSTYKTDAKDFGFLVPTPTQPFLAESRDLAFEFLGRVTDPPVPTRAGPGPGPGGPDKGKVEILEIKRVAGYVATVLKADDAAALNDWLKTNGYQSRPELKPWLEPYIKAGWIITAFKIASDTPKTNAIATSAVRMTFKTDRPFYPYREPPAAPPSKKSDKKADMPPNRLLRIYVLSKGRVEASLGKGKWPGKTLYANTFSMDNCKTLAWLLQVDDWEPTGTWWLTEMADTSSPRRGTDDLFFTTSTDQSEVNSRTNLEQPPQPSKPR